MSTPNDTDTQVSVPVKRPPPFKRRGRLIENVRGKGEIRKVDDHSTAMPYLAWKDGDRACTAFVTLTAARKHIGHDTSSKKVSA